ncbi:MAG: hypothetical protein DMF64_14415 [Acidobacteria bacterium]|nr:MAG: hypothetical protein DMF64_14415 [Acidobacteriota bacterium]
MLRTRTRRAALAALALTLAVVAFLTPAPSLIASDHGDAPYNSSDQSIDGADAYAFLDPTDNTRVILSLTSRGFIAAGENNNFGQFDPSVRYRFEIELNGDPKPDAFIDITFSRRTGATAPQVATITLLNGQTFTANSTPPSVCIAGSANCPPAPTITDLGTTGVRFYAGMRDDTFNFDIPAFAAATAALRACVAAQNPPDQTCANNALANFQRGRDSFAGYNVMNIALSIPKSLFGTPTNNIIGVNGVLQRRSPQLFLASPDQVKPGANYPATGFGRWVTLDRNGNPAVNAVLIPFGRKDEYNAATTMDDAAGRFAADIVASLQALGTNTTNINILAGVAVTNGDMLRLNLNTANTSLGFGEEIYSTANYVGYPNGRRPGDDVVDTLLFFIANQPSGGITDNANVNEVPFLSAFPFFPPPHQPRPVGAGAEDLTRN